MMQSRRNWLTRMALAITGVVLAKNKTFALPPQGFQDKFMRRIPEQLTYQTNNMKVGAFSVSLNVKDINASKTFYESLGFTVFAGGMEKNYLIMKNENALIGLFHGMFKKTILTFNPGWDENANKLAQYDDVREIQRQLKSKQIKILTEADEKSSGPASIVVIDPDGNQILFDQHI